MEKKYLGLITRCKDEYFIGEFVRYYLAQGVDHIYIIDDDSTNLSYYDGVKNLNKVSIIFEKNIITRNIASKIYSRVRNNFEWMIYIDVDEFIVTKKNFARSLRDELAKTFSNCDCIKIPWVLMSANGIKKSPASVLKENLYRWNHDKQHPNPVHKFRCRYEEIEVKCIFKTACFRDITYHHPKEKIKFFPKTVNSINLSKEKLTSFYQSLREKDIQSGYLLCYHYRIISIDNCVSKLETNKMYIDNGYTLQDLMKVDYPEIYDDTLKKKMEAVSKSN